MKYRASIAPLLATVAIAIVLTVLFVKGREGFQSVASATTTVSDTTTAQPFKSTWVETLANPPEWFIWTIVIIVGIGIIIGWILTTYNWYRGVSAGVSAVGNLSSAGSNWMRAKANKNRANKITSA